MSKSFIEQSKSNWVARPDPENPANNQLILGCLQRIAISMEKIAFTLEIVGNHSQVSSKLHDDLARSKRINKKLKMKILKLEAKELAE